MNLTWTNYSGKAFIAVDQLLSLCTILTYHKNSYVFKKIDFKNNKKITTKIMIS